MREGLTVVGGVLSTGCLVALGVYAGLAYWGKSAMLYSTAGHVGRPRRTTLFLVLAGIGFLVCCWCGAETMLWWVPGSWGHVDESGEWEPLRIVLTGMFTFYAGIAFIVFIDKATHEKVWLSVAREELANVNKVLLASQDRRWLSHLAEEFEQKSADLGARMPSGENLWSKMVRAPELERIGALRRCAAAARAQADRVDQVRG